MRIRRLAAGALLGAATSALLLTPAAAATDSTMTTYAGTGTAGPAGDGGPATAAQLNQPSGVWLDNAANVFVGDTFNHRIRKVTFDNKISTVAGTGVAGFSGDGGPATAAKLNGPTGVVTSSTGTMYIADTLNNRVRKVEAGVITTVAGMGAPGMSGDGRAAMNAKLSAPTGLALSSTGSLYIADTGNNVVRELKPNGIITTFAGSGQPGFSGNTGAATKARLRAPTGLATRGTTVLIADTSNSQVRKVSGGTITALAGTGAPGFSGDGGQAASARLAGPTGVGYDPLGTVYITDAGNYRVRQVTASGVISTLAGTGTAGDSGDGGPCELAQLRALGGVSADADNVFFGDTGSHKVKRCHKKDGPPPALPEASLALAGSALVVLGGGVALTRRARRRSMAAPLAS